MAVAHPGRKQPLCPRNLKRHAHTGEPACQLPMTLHLILGWNFACSRVLPGSPIEHERQGVLSQICCSRSKIGSTWCITSWCIGSCITRCIATSSFGSILGCPSEGELRLASSHAPLCCHLLNMHTQGILVYLWHLLTASHLLLKWVAMVWGQHLRMIRVTLTLPHQMCWQWFECLFQTSLHTTTLIITISPQLI